MDSIHDLLQQKAAQLDFHAKRSAYELIQDELDRYYDGYVRLKIIRRDGTAVLITKSAGIASKVRFDQVRLLASMQSVYKIKKGIKKLQIIIG